jgi:hypothetical protein
MTENDTIDNNQILLLILDELTAIHSLLKRQDNEKQNQLPRKI